MELKPPNQSLFLWAVWTASNKDPTMEKNDGWKDVTMSDFASFVDKFSLQLKAWQGINNRYGSVPLVLCDGRRLIPKVKWVGRLQAKVVEIIKIKTHVTRMERPQSVGKYIESQPLCTVKWQNEILTCILKNDSYQALFILKIKKITGTNMKLFQTPRR